MYVPVSTTSRCLRILLSVSLSEYLLTAPVLPVRLVGVGRVVRVVEGSSDEEEDVECLRENAPTLRLKWSRL